MDPTLISITTQFDPRIVALLAWVVLIAKVAVDWVKTTASLPRWAPPASSFGLSVVLLLLLMVALEIPLAARLVAQAVLCALVATLLAIGTTALQSRTRPALPDPALVQATADELERRLRETAAEDADADLIARSG